MSDARTLYREGFQHFADDRLDEAITLYLQAVEVDPALAIAWNGLSMAYREKGDLDNAIKTGKKLIELEPDEALNHTNLSILYQNKGMIQEAEDEKAIAIQLEMKAQRNG